jgi:hypothetical protein
MLMAAAAASLILAGGIARAESGEKAGDQVACAGINACKGQGACAGAGNACAGQNGCKGQGVTKTTKDECAKKGGKVVEMPKKK